MQRLSANWRLATLLTLIVWLACAVSCHGPKPTGPVPLTDAQRHDRNLELIGQMIWDCQQYVTRIYGYRSSLDTLIVQGRDWPCHVPDLPAFVYDRDSLGVELIATGDSGGEHYRSTLLFSLTDTTQRHPIIPGEALGRLSGYMTHSVSHPDDRTIPGWLVQVSVSFQHLNWDMIPLEVHFSAGSKSTECKIYNCDDYRLSTWTLVPSDSIGTGVEILRAGTRWVGDIGANTSYDSTKYPERTVWDFSAESIGDDRAVVEITLDTAATVDTISLVPMSK